MLNNAAVKCMKMYVKDMDVKGNGCRSHAMVW